MSKARKSGNKKTEKRKYTFNPQLSNTRKPPEMSIAEWQTKLRQQIAEKTDFKFSNIGEGLVFSDYKVYNSDTKNNYKVALRSDDNSLNYCSCYDFKTNQLGTCKHIEAVLMFIRKRPSLRKALNQPYSTTYSSMYMEYRGERKIKFRIGTENESEYNKLFKPYIDKTGCLNAKGFEEIDMIIQKALQMNASFRCYEDALSHIIQLREKKERKSFLAPYFKQNKLPEIRSLKVKPYPYQTEGILFCAAAGRSILADDMGLGKTIQAIAAAQLLHEHRQVQKVLIICPTSLKYQWQSEIEKFTTAATTVVEGNYLSREKLYKKEDSLYKIASYNMAVNDLELINEYQPDLIILDEAQRIKNWQTKISRSIKKLHSKYALVLTGTPLENKLQELYSLVQFIDPLHLGSLHSFISTYEQTDETGKVIGYQNLHEVKAGLKHILLRRTKKEVLRQLPVRTDKNLFVSVTGEQRAIHNDYAEIVRKIINRWKKMGFLKEEDRQRLMIALNMMRMVCNSTYIIDQETNYQTKLDELFDILEEVITAGEEKIVIFSQWERFTRLIAAQLDAQKIGYANLNGNIPSHKRKDLFDRFNNDDSCRVFLSTDAGGVGLNLQAGSVLFNMDLPWNPAVLEQRISRIYRQGQKRNVKIINFIARNTIEHGMLGKLRFKRALADGILDNGESNIFVGDSKFNVFMKDIEGMFTDETLATTHLGNDHESEATVEEPAEVTEKETTEAYEDDDVKQTTPAKVQDQTESFNNQPAQQLIQTAGSFFAQLGNVLSDSKATENLLESITKKDEATGQTYLQVPVENESVVKNALTILAGLFKGMTGK